MRKRVAIVGCLGALAVAPSAHAGGSPSTDAYASPGERTQSALAAAPAKLQTGSNGGTQLPMTGMDLSVIGAAGLGVAGMGFALRRLAGRQEKD